MKLKIEVRSKLGHVVKGTSPQSKALDTNIRRNKRTTLSKPTKFLLEEVFRRKPCPNRAERLLISKKTGLTPLQVRVWVCIRVLQKTLTIVYEQENTIQMND